MVNGTHFTKQSLVSFLRKFKHWQVTHFVRDFAQQTNMNLRLMVGDCRN